MSNTNFVKRAKFQTLQDPILERMLAAASDFACSINVIKPARWLSFCGSPGTGKTYLAKAIYRIFNETIRHHIGITPDGRRLTGQRGDFVDWRTLCSAVKQGGWGWVEDLIEDDFVVLDDIGAEYDKAGSGFTTSLLDRILNSRLRKWTLITSNLSLREISEQLEDRIASRMIRDGSVVIECNTVDFAMRS